MLVDKTSDIQKAFSRFLPLTTAAVSISAAGAPEVTPIRAKLAYEVVGVCPYCNNTMSYTEACGQRVYLCDKDRFVSPLPNAEL